MGVYSQKKVKREQMPLKEKQTGKATFKIQKKARTHTQKQKGFRYRRSVVPPCISNFRRPYWIDCPLLKLEES
jgi:hypothetical protein